MAQEPPARTDHLDVATARALVSVDLGLVAATTAALDDGDDALAVGTRLRTGGLPPARAAAVLDAATARRRLRDDGHPAADLLVVSGAALEQASPRAAARWRGAALRRASSAAGDDLVDLCAGAGLDALALAGEGFDVRAVELDEARAVLAAHNAEATGARVRVEVGDALATSFAARVHADPSRRDERGRRLVALAATRPPVPALLRRWRERGSAALAVSCSPAVDLADPDLPAEAELAFLEVGDALVDAVLLRGDGVQHGARRAVLLDRDGGVVDERAGPSGPVPTGSDRTDVPGTLDDRRADATGQWLVEARPSLVRARLHEGEGAVHGLVRASRRRALLLGERPPDDGTWFTARKVVADLPGRGRALRRWLADRPSRPVEVVLHGARVDVGRFRAEAGRPPTGPSGWRAELVAVDGGVRLLVTAADP